MSKHFQREIERLKERILDVGAYVEEAISGAVKSLIDRDAALAEKIIASDVVIDRMEVHVEEECLKILALHQPVAADLRFVISVLKINNDLERVGDLARNIAKRVAFLCNGHPFELPRQFRPMAAKAQEMLKGSLDALVNSDAQLAERIQQDDDAVDAYRRAIREFVLREIQKQPDRAEDLMKFDAVSKHLERIADMATNISEDVIYMVTGDIVRHHLEHD